MTRDFTSEQYARALARNGFRHVAFGVADTTGALPSTLIIGAVIDPVTGALRRRSSLARAIAYRKRHGRP